MSLSTSLVVLKKGQGSATGSRYVGVGPAKRGGVSPKAKVAARLRRIPSVSNFFILVFLVLKLLNGVFIEGIA